MGTDVVSPEVLKRHLEDKHWRRSNLYWIRDKQGERTIFKPNWAQKEVRLTHKNLALKVRQVGITTGLCVRWLDSSIFGKDLKTGIVAHTKDDASKIFREKILFPYENLPADIRSVVRIKKQTETEIVFSNGSEISVGVSYRSGTIQILHVTEYGYTCSHMPARAEEIKTGAFNAVPDKGITVVESTAKGRAGDFYEMCQEAQKGNEWHFMFFPWWKHPEYANYELEPFAERRDIETEYLDKLEGHIHLKLTPEQRRWWCLKRRDQGDKMFSEYPSTPEEAFQQTTEGAYYGRLMIEAWQSGRVTSIPVDPSLPVETWWDIGYGDSTAIWFAQRQGYEIRLVDYYENSGEGVAHYAEYIREWSTKYNVRTLRCIGPHDLRHGTWSTGESQLATAAAHGLRFEIAPEKSIADGIEAVRKAIPRCAFDESRCGDGLQALESYRKKWNDGLGTWHNQPLHDWASHGADAFRYGVLTMAEAPIVTVAAKSPARQVARVKWM